MGAVLDVELCRGVDFVVVGVALAEDMDAAGVFSAEEVRDNDVVVEREEGYGDGERVGSEVDVADKSSVVELSSSPGPSGSSGSSGVGVGYRVKVLVTVENIFPLVVELAMVLVTVREMLLVSVIKMKAVLVLFGEASTSPRTGSGRVMVMVVRMGRMVGIVVVERGLEVRRFIVWWVEIMGERGGEVERWGLGWLGL